MKFFEKTVSSKLIYKGKILNLRVDKVSLPNDAISSREIIEFPQSVSVIAITKDNEVVLVRQYRKPCERELLEIVAGKVDKDEEPLQCAKRELSEETGYTCNEWKKISSFYTTPGYSNEYMTMYLAMNATKGISHPDEDEFLDVVEIPVEELIRRVENGEIHDAKTVMAAFYIKAYI